MVVIYQLLLKHASTHVNKTWGIFLTIWRRSMQVKVERKVQRKRMLLALEVKENIVEQQKGKVEPKNENLSSNYCYLQTPSITEPQIYMMHYYVNVVFE